MRIFVLPILFSVGICGCSIHPQTEDFSRDIIPNIIQKIRCEAKESVLEAVPDPNSYLRKTAISYRFLFTLTEKNEAGAKGSISWPITPGIFKLGFGGGLDKVRKATQEIKIEDTFAELSLLNCSKPAPGRNFIYPITGEIGILATFDNFVRLAEAKPGDISTFSDNLQFTTTIDGSLSPEWTLAAGSKIIGIEANISAERIDDHRVELSFEIHATPEQERITERKNEAARLLALKMLRDEKSIPSLVQLVDAKGKIISPTAIDMMTVSDPDEDTGESGTQQLIGKPGSKGKKQPPIPHSRQIGIPANPVIKSTRESPSDIKKRSLRNSDFNRSIFQQDEILRGIGE